jgi:hypothetical protein
MPSNKDNPLNLSLKEALFAPDLILLDVTMPSEKSELQIGVLVSANFRVGVVCNIVIKQPRLFYANCALLF